MSTSNGSPHTGSVFKMAHGGRQRDHTVARTTHRLNHWCTLLIYACCQQALGIESYGTSTTSIIKISESVLHEQHEHQLKLGCWHRITIGRPAESTRTRRNSSAVSAILATCEILRHLATPSRWKDMEMLFGELQGSCIASKDEMYAKAVLDKDHALENCIEFIDGTVIGINRPRR
eukprot:IDg14841t1